MKKIILLFISLNFLLTGQLSAQGFFDKLAGEIDFDLKSPQGSLKDNGLTNFYGGSLAVYYVGCTEKKFKFTPGYRIIGGITKTIEGNIIPLSEPDGGMAVEGLFNAYFGIELVGRVIYDDGKWYRPYAEAYTGPRFMAAYEKLSPTEFIEGYGNNSRQLFKNTSMVTGLGIGVLFQLSDALDLNLKVATEYSGQVDHSNLDQADFYSTEKIESHNTFSNSFSIGIFLRPFCGRRNNTIEDEKSKSMNSNPSYFIPKRRTRTKAVQRKPIQKK